MAEFKLEYNVFEKGLLYEGKSSQLKTTLTGDLQGKQTLQDILLFCKSNLIFIAKSVLKEELARGFPKNYRILTDGKPDSKEDSVSPLGKIQYVAPVAITKILQDTYTALVDKSPVDTGRYSQSHRVFLNGNVVAKNSAELASWLAKNPPLKNSDIVSIINIQPYARRLERFGITKDKRGDQGSKRYRKSTDKKKRSGPQVLAPNGVYYLVSRSIIRKYKAALGVKFTFTSGSQIRGQTADGSVTRTHGGKFKKRSREKNASFYLYPTIQFVISKTGVQEAS